MLIYCPGVPSIISEAFFYPAALTLCRPILDSSLSTAPCMSLSASTCTVMTSRNVYDQHERSQLFIHASRTPHAQHFNTGSAEICRRHQTERSTLSMNIAAF